jgi:hypothetical protein
MDHLRKTREGSPRNREKIVNRLREDCKMIAERQGNDYEKIKRLGEKRIENQIAERPKNDCLEAEEEPKKDLVGTVK